MGGWRLDLELKSRTNLNGTWRADGLVPTTKVGATNVVVERETRALVIYVGGIEEVMLVKGVEELKAKLKVHTLSQICVFRQGEIEALSVGTSQT